jgi:DNA gyrase subunit B
VPFLAYVAAERDGKLPEAIWRIARPGKIGRSATSDFGFILGEADLERRLADLAKALGREPRVFEDGDDAKHREQADLLLSRIYEHQEIERAVKAVEKLGIDIRRCTPETSGGGNGHKPLWRILVDGAEPAEVGTPRAILSEMRKAGQRGVDVQRYKGLGEMNADQLKDTTMDPERRTLLKVTMTDAAESDRLFGLLMGESVEPRKVFIEQHALEVTNLDV